MAGQVRDM